VWSNSQTATTITPRRNDDDRDAAYEITDATVVDATRYYYKIKAIGSNPDVPPEQNFTYSAVGASVNQGWDRTPDATAPELPTGLKVKDIHDDGTNYKRNIITWARITNPLRNGVNDFSEYRIYRSNDGLVWSQICKAAVDSVNTVYLPGGCDDSRPNPLYDANKEIGLATNYYMDLIPIGESNQFYFYHVTAVDDAKTEFTYTSGSIINTYSNESKPVLDSLGNIVSVSLNPFIAKPSITTSVAGKKAILEDVGVSTAVVSWTTDQPADTIVEFRKSGTSDPYIGVVNRSMVISHRITAKPLEPNTRYDYRVISRNSLANDVIASGSELPTLTTTGFNITPGTVSSTTSTTEISWTTNLDASSAFVEYQLQRQPSDDAQGGTAGVEPSVLASSPRSHRVVVKGLRSARTYTYKIKSISKDGYLSEYPGGEFATFKTKSFDSAQFTLAPASSNVAERNITATTAQIVWQTESPTTSWVDYSTKSGVYDNAAGNNDLVGVHVIVIEGLIPGTKYYYRVRVKDANEVEYTSQEYSFTAVLKPKISNMTVKDVTPYSITIAWDTNVDTETIINWGKTAAYGEKRGKSGVSKVHELVVDKLEDNQEYHYQILAKDDAGNEVADADKIVRTPLDTEGPKITNVKIDVLPMGESDTTSSIIVSWTTNKPASTLVEYGEGVIGGTYDKRSVEDASLNNSHTVIIKGLTPATSYHYRLVSADKRNNQTISQDYTFVTPAKEKSILQLILKSLEETFAWTRNLNQFFGNIGKRLTGSN
jgi:phosphodiesterase/alkaline phosphatase D-like protein